ncbi:MAG: hypothetical protein ACP5OG_01020 [Candidatus Nanoarchaeia archaeon]
MKLFLDLEYIHGRLENPHLTLEEKSFLEYPNYQEQEPWKKVSEAKQEIDELRIDGSAILLPYPFECCITSFLKSKEFYSVFTNFCFNKDALDIPEQKTGFFKKLFKKQECFISYFDFGIENFSREMEKNYNSKWISSPEGDLSYLLKQEKMPPIIITGPKVELSYFLSMGMAGSEKKLFNKPDFIKDLHDYEKVTNIFVNSMFDSETNEKLKDVFIDMFGI